MKTRWAAVAVFLALVSGASAWRPSGWVFFDWPFAMDASGDWHWMSPEDNLWVHGDPPAAGWQLIEDSGLARGWAFFEWPHALGQEEEAWYYVNETDRKWCVNMRTGRWSFFGVPALTTEFVAVDGVAVADFWIGRHEVTLGEWRDVNAWALANGYAFDNAGAGCADDHPVHTVNWHDCAKWCNAKSEKDGKTPVYLAGGAVYRSGRRNDVVANAAAEGYRLPTEPEWEIAAKGGRFGTEKPYAGGETLGEVGWYEANSGGAPCALLGDRGTWPVGQKAANELGLFDMSGNVWEWCFDWNPSSAGSMRIYRGGSWIDLGSVCGVLATRSANPGFAYAYGGFRLATSAPP
jgi:formylglycine-generating enzyme required for sulfatase activity